MVNIREAWSRLLSVRELVFEAQSRAFPTTGWNGRGTGVVRVETVSPTVILFHEHGTWAPEVGRPTAFTNVFRWTADAVDRSLRLEHLRFGQDRPVYLFDLVAVGENALEPAEPHVCREDRYSARMELDDRTVHLRWSIAGPRKAETIAYEYT